MEKLVSVIIPVYNQEELIIRALDSIPKRKDIEILVINDGSTDGTRKAIQKYQNTHKNRIVELYNLEENHGVSYARNKGLANAKGEYILFMDSDDWIDTKIFNEIVDKELRMIDIVFYDMIDNDGNEYTVDKHRVFNRVGTFKFVRKEFIDRYPMTRYKVGLQYGEDALFHEALMCKNPTFVCTNKLMYHYNFPREGSLTYLYNHR